MIWVRSQHKETLVKCSEVFLDYNRYGSTSYNICGDGFELGKYSNKEKAMKVLDMIQERICGIERLRIQAHIIERVTSYNIDTTDYIFQMPLDSEVLEDD